MDGESSPASRAARAKYKRPLAEYAPVYARGIRQLKTWIRAGKACDPPDLPPLDAPTQMAAWWERVQRRRVPECLLLHAVGSPIGSGGRPLELAEIEAVEGQAVTEARQLASATMQQLRDAYRAGNDPLIERLQRRYVSSIAMVTKVEAAARQEARHRGDLIPKSELLPELSHFMSVLRVMRSTLSRRIRARLALPAEFDAKLDEVIESERRAEESVFRQLGSLTDLDDLQMRLFAPQGQASG